VRKQLPTTTVKRLRKDSVVEIRSDFVAATRWASAADESPERSGGVDVCRGGCGGSGGGSGSLRLGVAIWPGLAAAQIHVLSQSCDYRSWPPAIRPCDLERRDRILR